MLSPEIGSCSMLTIFILVFDGCAVAKYQLLSVLNLTVPFSLVFTVGLTLM